MDAEHEDRKKPKGHPYAADYPDCLAIIEEKVKPERTRLNDKGEFALRKPLPQKWWIYAEKRPALYKAIAGRDRVLALSLVNNHLGFAFEPVDIVFAHRLAVFPFEEYSAFSILQSNFHY